MKPFWRFDRKDSVASDVPDMVAAPQEDRRFREFLDRCPAQLKEQQERLLELSGGTEGEFLAIGAKLHDFYSRAVEISRSSAQIVDDVGAGALEETIGGLQSLTDKMTNLLTLMEAEAKRCREILQRTLQLTGKVDEPLSGFRKIMKVLHVLGISTKIESSRLSQLGTGFYSLASDVERLAVLIHEKSSRILEENNSLAARISDILHKVINNESVQYDYVANALEKTYTSLAVIRGLRSRYAEAAGTVTSASDMVSGNISEVVTSMQFHDITRQQIEHVQEALGYLTVRLEEEQTSSDDAVLTRLVTDLAGVCRLQSAQLEHARVELVAAVESIVANLSEIMASQQLIAHQASNIVQADHRSGGTLFTDIEKCLGIVAHVVIDSAEMTRSLSDAVTGVAQTIGTISAFVEDIENIGEEINLIAINSQVRAAHTGTEGAALGVLAEAIQRLSVDACHQTVTVSDTLREVSQVTDELCSSDRHDFVLIEAETENLSHDITRLVGLLRDMNASLDAHLATSDDAVCALVADINSVSAGITIQDTVGSGLAAVITELDGLVAGARELVPDLPEADLSQLHDTYTMQSERHVHAAVLEGRQIVAGAGRPLAPPVVETDDGLGDNVELF